MRGVQFQNLHLPARASCVAAYDCVCLFMPVHALCVRLERTGPDPFAICGPADSRSYATYLACQPLLLSLTISAGADIMESRNIWERYSLCSLGIGETCCEPNNRNMLLLLELWWQGWASPTHPKKIGLGFHAKITVFFMIRVS